MRKFCAKTKIHYLYIYI